MFQEKYDDNSCFGSRPHLKCRRELVVIPVHASYRVRREYCSAFHNDHHPNKRPAQISKEPARAKILAFLITVDSHACRAEISEEPARANSEACPQHVPLNLKSSRYVGLKTTRIDLTGLMAVRPPWHSEGRCVPETL